MYNKFKLYKLNSSYQKKNISPTVPYNHYRNGTNFHRIQSLKYSLRIWDF